MDSSNDEATSGCMMSREDEACLKTALAFTVLRNKLCERNEAEEEDQQHQEPPPFVSNLFSNTNNTNVSTLPLNSTATTTSGNSSHVHLEKMFQVAIVTTITATNNNTENKQQATLNGICQHLALQLLTRNSMENWIQETLSVKNIVAVCRVWHGILQAQPSLGGSVLVAVGRVLQHLYKSTTTISSSNVAIKMVQLVQLAQASICLRLFNNIATPQVLLQELSNSMGSTLCLPIASKDLAYFVLQQHKSGNSTPGNQILLRCCIYDLMEKLSSCCL